MLACVYDGLDELGDTIDRQHGAREAPTSDEYVHLGEFTECHVNGQVFGHHQLRVKMADVTAWTYGEPTPR